MTLEEWVKVAAPIIQVVTVVLTAIFASFQLSAWRRQQLGKRKIEIAEEGLVAVYKARANLRVVRSPAAWTGEGESRPKETQESAAEARWRSLYYVPLERLNRFKDDFAHFEKTKVLVQVYFGPAATESLEEIIGVYNEVAIAGRMLASARGERDLGADFVQELQRKIWESGEDDRLKKKIDSAVNKIEGIFRRHVK